jgi:hypothetical protein
MLKFTENPLNIDLLYRRMLLFWEGGTPKEQHVYLVKAKTLFLSRFKKL